jgi:hypothetical protein
VIETPIQLSTPMKESFVKLLTLLAQLTSFEISDYLFMKSMIGGCVGGEKCEQLFLFIYLRGCVNGKIENFPYSISRSICASIVAICQNSKKSRWNI